MSTYFDNTYTIINSTVIVLSVNHYKGPLYLYTDDQNQQSCHNYTSLIKECAICFNIKLKLSNRTMMCIYSILF